MHGELSPNYQGGSGSARDVDRQYDAKGRADAECALDFDSAVVRFNDAFGNREAEPGAQFSRGRSHAGAAKGLE